MSKLNRRDFVKLTGGAAVASMVVGFPHIAGAASKKVVIVGGGMGGATAAKYLRMIDSSVDVTLIEANADYHTCFMSNEVIAGERSIDSIRFGYDGLQGHGVKVVKAAATGIDPAAKKVSTADGQTFDYDRCIVSPGVDFKWETIGGYDASVAETIPHAWKAGPQTATLRKQLEAMSDGGTVIICAPPNPFRCPPGPYERASLIAHYLKHNKPKSKVLILDPKDKFSKFGLFTGAWTKFYGYGTDNSMITWVKGADGGTLESVDAGAMTVQAAVEAFKGDVINIIPAQKAGEIAFAADLVEDDWCPVNKKTFESTRHPGVHVIGDASSAAAMPKSGYAASSQAKVCAAAVADLLAGRDPGVPTYVNTCYSIAAEGHGFSVAAVYRLSEDGGTIAGVEGAGGLTPGDASPEQFAREVEYAHSWFKNITHDTFG